MQQRYIVVIVNLLILAVYSIYHMQLPMAEPSEGLAKMISHALYVGIHISVCYILGVISDFKGKRELKIGFYMSWALVFLIGFGVCFIK
jgi:hypothetical protein